MRLMLITPMGVPSLIIGALRSVRAPGMTPGSGFSFLKIMNMHCFRVRIARPLGFTGLDRWQILALAECPNDATNRVAVGLQRGESVHPLPRIAAPHFLATISNTGWMLVGELAITPKISLVAVCCSNASCQFLEQPDVLNGDHGLVGESFEELDLRRGKGRTSVRRAVSDPVSLSVLMQGSHKNVR